MNKKHKMIFLVNRFLSSKKILNIIYVIYISFFMYLLFILFFFWLMWWINNLINIFSLNFFWILFLSLFIIIFFVLYMFDKGDIKLSIKKKDLMKNYFFVKKWISWFFIFFWFFIILCFFYLIHLLNKFDIMLWFEDPFTLKDFFFFIPFILMYLLSKIKVIKEFFPRIKILNLLLYPFIIFYSFIFK